MKKQVFRVLKLVIEKIIYGDRILSHNNQLIPKAHNSFAQRDQGKRKSLFDNRAARLRKRAIAKKRKTSKT